MKVCISSQMTEQLPNGKSLILIADLRNISVVQIKARHLIFIGIKGSHNVVSHQL
jgi:hypothetical protein